VIHIPAGTAHAVTLRAGQSLRIVNVEGGQVASFIAFNAGDMNEALSTVHTLVSLGRLFPTKGDALIAACEFDTSLAKPGDVVELRALMDLVAAVSACPMDPGNPARPSSSRRCAPPARTRGRRP